MTHIMLDLETWGNRPGCAVRSVGAAAFDPGGDGTTATFYCNVADRSCWIAGLTIDRTTSQWWEAQSKEAREIFAKNPVPIEAAVSDFNSWFRGQNGAYVWCQGSGFDTSIWEAAARAVKSTAPWKFWDLRDTRTIYHAAGLDERMIPRVGVAHNALDDAVHQVQCVQAAYKMMREEIWAPAI